MTHEQLRDDRRSDANLELAASGLVMGTFGNVSAVDRSGRRLRDQAERRPLRAADAGAHGRRSRSTTGAVRRQHAASVLRHADAPRAVSRLRLRRHRPHALGVRHVFAQARQPIRCMGTTHADYFRGDIPVTRPMRRDEVERDYEKNTGLVIVETFRAGGLSPDEVPAVLVANHGPFTWGADAVQGDRARARSSNTSRASSGASATLSARRAARPTTSWSRSTTRASTGRRRTTGRGMKTEDDGRGAVLWDLDGTLVDSEDYHWRVVARHDAPGRRRAHLRAVPRELRPANDRILAAGSARTSTPDAHSAHRRRRRKREYRPSRRAARPDAAARRARVAGALRAGRLAAGDRLVGAARQRRGDAARARARALSRRDRRRPKT